MATQTVTAHLALNMGFMTLGTFRNLAVHLMTEGTELFCMGTFIIGKILTRSFVAGKARIFYIIGKIEGKGLMGIGMTGKTVLQFIM